MAQSLSVQLQSITSSEDEGQLRQLQIIIDALAPGQCSEEDIAALLGVFERFPMANGLGVFWAIVHFLEACEGYESPLISSVRCQPVEFNVIMVNRLMNAGVAEVGGQDLLSVLESAARNDRATAEAKRLANKFIDYQRRRAT